MQVNAPSIDRGFSFALRRPVVDRAEVFLGDLTKDRIDGICDNARAVMSKFLKIPPRPVIAQRDFLDR
jgi:hypothetical protein